MQPVSASIRVRPLTAIYVPNASGGK